MHNLTLGYLNVGESNLCLRKKVFKSFYWVIFEIYLYYGTCRGTIFWAIWILVLQSYETGVTWEKVTISNKKQSNEKNNNNNNNNQRTSDLSRPPNSYFDLQMKSKGNFERQQACGPCLQSPPSLKQNRFCLRAEGGAPVHRRGHWDFWCCGVAYFFCAQDCSE